MFAVSLLVCVGCCAGLGFVFVTKRWVLLFVWLRCLVFWWLLCYGIVVFDLLCLMVCVGLCVVLIVISRFGWLGCCGCAVLGC